MKDKETTLHSLGILKRYARTTADNYKAGRDRTEQLILAMVNELTSEHRNPCPVQFYSDINTGTNILQVYKSFSHLMLCFFYKYARILLKVHSQVYFTILYSAGSKFQTLLLVNISVLCRLNMN